MHVLIVETGKHKGKRLKLPNGETVIGRDPEVQLRIASNEVSRRHCALLGEGSRLTVWDLGSSNGTFVNGAPIGAPHVLKPGDLLVVGPMAFRFQGVSAPAPAPISSAAPVSIAAPPTAPAGEPLSDDEIALMLSDDTIDAVNTEDTAVISVDDTGARKPAVEPIKPPVKKVFRTVAEEAADIIRRHQESREQPS